METGRASVGGFSPRFVGPKPNHPGWEESFAWLRSLTGLTATVSDVLEDMGLVGACEGSLAPLSEGDCLVGPVVTMQYLPQRSPQDGTRLAHKFAYTQAEAGSVLVISGDARYSVMGGLAAHAAKAAGLGGCIVDGAVRDVDEILDIGLSVFAAARTARTGRRHMEAVSVNLPIACDGVWVEPGDIAVADGTGICFIPQERFEAVVRRVREISEEEGAIRRG